MILYGGLIFLDKLLLFVMQKLFFILFVMLFFPSYIFTQTNPNHPNILLIVVDDMGVDVMNGYHNNSLMPTTPTLDSLRMEGLTFKNAWSAPVCSPTRASIMTGKYGNKNCVLDIGNLDTIHTSIFQAVELQTGGIYSDAVIGKWHLSQPPDFNHPSQLGIDYYKGFFNNSPSNYYSWTMTFEGNQSTVDEYTTSYLTNTAVDWINSQNQAWFLWLAHAAPHSPFNVPPAGTYSQFPTNSNQQKFIAMIENMDYEIGRLLYNIPTAVRENTIIIFVGDNGTPKGVIQNFNSDQSKGTVYQGGVHIPFVVSGKGVSRLNEQENGLVHVVDIYATILDMVGGNLPGGIHNSYSFHDALSSNVPLRPYNYTEIGVGSSSNYAIRNDQYKLIEKVDGTQEFYDLLIDSLETNNLIGSLDDSQTAIRLELENEAYNIRTSWSCKDGIQNGAETSIDCGSNNCFNCPTPNNLACNFDTIYTCNDIYLDTSMIAENIVSSQHKISSQNARLWAGECIILEEGFEFDGDELEIKINNCTVTGIDDNNCPNSNVTSQTNIGCCLPPDTNSEYEEIISSDLRIITSNNLPNHDHCYAGGNMPYPIMQSFQVDLTPTLASTSTSILGKNNQPDYFFGVALNGVKLAPAPAQPFIFTNTITGEYNWNWVNEPTNVQGQGAEFVGLDCSSGHTGPNHGYHYHGNMFQYVEEIIQSGLSTTTTPPAGPVLLGWAADGYPIIYRFGPDDFGGLVLLQPSYQLKYGNRPGDGISAPCGSYNGRYTNDYEYIECSGDLDECNGIQRTITLSTPQGVETFDYFYVITDAFPQISRCFSGTPDDSFK